jgi:activator of 2-hydroxyglutaryl-CoA dehydratase
MATGYGRNLFEIAFDAQRSPKSRPMPKGARAIFPEKVTVLDIGGQDSKAISLFENGKVKNSK